MKAKSVFLLALISLAALPHCFSQEFRSIFQVKAVYEGLDQINDIQTLDLIGHGCLKYKLFKEAEEVFKKQTHIDSSNPLGWKNLVLLYGLSGEIKTIWASRAMSRYQALSNPLTAASFTKSN